jgi:hypothetical protein
MRSSAISRGLCLALLATAARAQTVAAGARAIVNTDTLPVYTAMSVSSAVKATLARGDSVSIGLVLFGDDITWCAISKTGETRRLGFASCEFLEADRSAASAPTDAPRAPLRPISIREVPPEAIAIREAPMLPPLALPPAPEPVPVREPAPPPAPAPVPEAPPPAVPAPVREPAPAEPPPATAPIPEPAPTPVVPVREPQPAAVPAPLREPPPPEPAPAPAVIREPAPIAAPVPAPVPEPVAPPPSRQPAPAEPAPAPVAPPVPPPPAAVPVVEPPPPAANQTDFVEISLDGSGLRSSVASYTQTTHLLSFLDKGRLAEIDVPALDQILSEQFQPGAFYSAIGDQIRTNYAPERLPDLVAWLRSPVTKKMAELERHALRPESRDELVAFAQGLSKSPPVEARLLLAHRLYDSNRACDLEVEATIALVHTVALAIGPALPKDKRYSKTELDRALGSVKSRYRSIMKNARLVHYLFAYQSVSDEELEQYVGFLESETGKWFVGLVDKGFFDATEAISKNLMTEIPRQVKAKRR